MSTLQLYVPKRLPNSSCWGVVNVSNPNVWVISPNFDHRGACRQAVEYNINAKQIVSPHAFNRLTSQY